MKATLLSIALFSLALVSVINAQSTPTCATVNCNANPCCDAATLGAICYNNATHACIFNGNGAQKMLCAIGEQACNISCFDPTEYVCNPYSVLISSETVVSTAEVLCPIATPDACGLDCYSPSDYSCCQYGPDYAPSLSNPARPICQLRETIFTCFDNQTSKCCENDLSHGLGSVCPLGSLCCGSFANVICTDTSTQQCCPASIAPTNCALDQTCCGEEYPTCINSDEICCCAEENSTNVANHFACPSNNTCDCQNSKCVAP